MQNTNLNQCMNCKKAVASNKSHCSHCGVYLGSYPAALPPVISATPPAVPNQTWKNGFLIWVFAAVVAALIALGVFCQFLDSKQVTLKRYAEPPGPSGRLQLGMSLADAEQIMGARGKTKSENCPESSSGCLRVTWNTNPTEVPLITLNAIFADDELILASYFYTYYDERQGAYLMYPEDPRWHIPALKRR
jgi:hypothetical protein